MPRLMGMFHERFPTIQMTLTVDTSRRICRAISNGDIDVGIIGGEVPKDLSQQLQVIPYAQDELVLVVPRAHALARRGTAIEKEELYQLEFVSLNQGSTVQASAVNRPGVHCVRGHGGAASDRGHGPRADASSPAAAAAASVFKSGSPWCCRRCKRRP